MSRSRQRMQSGRTAAPANTAPAAVNDGVVFATGGYDHTIKFWGGPALGSCLRQVEFADSQVNALEVSPNKVFLAAAGNPTVYLYDINVAHQKPTVTLEGHASNVQAVGFSRDSSWLYTGSEDGTLKIWDLRVNGHQRTFDNVNHAPISSVVLHPNQVEVITGDENGFIRCWDLVAGKWISESCPQPRVPIQSISMDSFGRLLSMVNNAGNCFLWRPQVPESIKADLDHAMSSTTVGPIRVHETYVLKCKISPDRKLLATTSADRTVKIWHIEDNSTELSLVRILGKHQRWVHDCVFSADSAYLVTACSDQHAYLWDLTSGMLMRQYPHDKAVTAVALNDTAVEVYQQQQ